MFNLFNLRRRAATRQIARELTIYDRRTHEYPGTPPALPAPGIQASGPGPAQDSATLTLTWEQGSPNGPPTTKYTLLCLPPT